LFEGSKCPPLAVAHCVAFVGVAVGVGLLAVREGVGSGLAEVDADGDGLGALPSVWDEAHAVSPIRPTIRAMCVLLISCLLRSVDEQDVEAVG
jgi:hypothetical protein